MDIKIVEADSLPRILREIPGSPERLFLKGRLPDKNKPTIAVVGTRKASPTGLKTAELFAKRLSELGVVIVSGLAMGIDTAAHRGALIAGGKTVAVLGNGLHKIYPAQNEGLANKILDMDGAILSEYKEGTPSYKDHFIQRNRIISGLSLGVIVIEAPTKSGALATASFAASQGREVFVVPGPVNHPNYQGSHSLIRDGARLVTSPEEILEDLGLDVILTSAKIETVAQSDINEEERVIIRQVKEFNSPLNVDKIIELTKLDPQIVNQALASLVVKGLIQEAQGGYTI